METIDRKPSPDQASDLSQGDLPLTLPVNRPAQSEQQSADSRLEPSLHEHVSDPLAEQSFSLKHEDLRSGAIAHETSKSHNLETDTRRTLAKGMEQRHSSRTSPIRFKLVGLDILTRFVNWLAGFIKALERRMLGQLYTRGREGAGGTVETIKSQRLIKGKLSSDPDEDEEDKEKQAPQLIARK